MASSADNNSLPKKLGAFPLRLVISCGIDRIDINYEARRLRLNEEPCNRWCGMLDSIVHNFAHALTALPNNSKPLKAVL